jgi:murein DD-endopeptidase MepM/ murein hydrolase activator NlpD
LATVTRPATATAEATASPTIPPPTFTPPPPPPPAAGEHLIFGRPVPAASTQWTDKAYPYGSTRSGTLQPHHGVEFAVPIGTPVLAAAGGTVRVAGSDDPLVYGPQPNFYGNLVIIEHAASPNGLALYTLYGHLSEVQVTVGQSVAAGEQIGLSGDAGVAYGPHLHFEVREGANTYMSTRNPLLWLRPLDGTGVVAGRVTFANGQSAYDAPITLRRVDGAAPYTASTSYAQSPVNSDLDWGENFALDDVVGGYYEITAGSGQATARQTLWVFPGRVNFVTLVLP